MSTGKSTPMGANTQAAMAPITDQQRDIISNDSSAFNAALTPPNTNFGGTMGASQGTAPAAAGTYGVSVGGNWWGSGPDPSESGYYWDPQTNQWARVVQYSNTGQPLNQQGR